METSIENLVVNYTAKNEISKLQEWSVRDFNNVENADRKLIINKKFEFWVQDEVLSFYSDYFAELFKLTLNESSKADMNASALNTQEEEPYRKSEITIPHEDVFLDILLWIYTKDGKKLQKTAKTFTSLICLISLGIHLRMRSEFFEILLSRTHFDWKLEYFQEKIWARSIFTFSILQRIVDEMKTNNATKIIAMLSWLKDVDDDESKPAQNTPVIQKTSQDFLLFSSSNVRNDEVLTSADLFLVRNYIKVNNLMSGLTRKEVVGLFSMFPTLHSAFDTEKLLNEFILPSQKKLVCIICKKTFISPQDVLESLECGGASEILTYHPKNIYKNDKSICLHEGCQKKLNKGELNCCHKMPNSAGCTVGEGKHMIIIEDQS